MTDRNYSQADIDAYWCQLCQIGLDKSQEIRAALASFPLGIREALDQLLEEHAIFKQATELGSTADIRSPGEFLPLCPGTLVGKRYRIKQSLGKGGMGTVYVAEDQSLNCRRVAVKAMNWNCPRTIEDELRVLVKLDHPSIVKIYDAVPATEQPPQPACVVMELVDSGNGTSVTLADTIAAERQGLAQRHTAIEKWDDETKAERALNIADMMLPVAQALKHAHDRNIIHRDIKPSNLLRRKLDHQTELVVGDWGLGRVYFENWLSTVSAVGTVNYCAPEIYAPAKGTTVDQRCDIYSFGVTLYEAATLRLPTRSNGKGPIPGANLHPSFDYICRKCMEVDPTLRYANASELIADLEQFTAGRPIHASKRKSLSARLIFIVLGSIFFPLIAYGILKHTLSAKPFNKLDSVATVSVAPDSTVAEVKELISNRNFELAAEKLSPLLVGDSAAEFALMATILEAQQKYPEALAASTTAKELGGSTENDVLHARLLTFVGKWDDALVELDQLVSRYPQDPLPLLERCEVQGFTKNWQACKQDFLKLKTIFPNRNHARSGYIAACQANGDQELMLSELREFYQINRTHGKFRDVLAPGLEYGLSQVLTNAEYQQAYDYFSTLDQTDYFIQQICGMLLYRLKRYDEANVHLQTACDRQGAGGGAIELSFRAMCAVRQGHHDRAALQIEAATRAFTRMKGSHSRPPAVTATSEEIGRPTSFYQVRRWERALDEAQAVLSALDASHE